MLNNTILLQAKLRIGYSAIDHIFSIYGITELVKRRTKLYCSFINLEKNLFTNFNQIDKY